MSDEYLRSTADRLLAARRERLPVPPISATDTTLGLGEAYGIQLQQVTTWLAEGRKVAGYKVGLTSAAIQRQLGVDQPDFGHLFDDDFILSGEAIASTRFIQPRVEPEIAFVLGRPLAGPGVTVAEAIRAVDFAVASLEIIDSRIENWLFGHPVGVRLAG